MDIVALCSVAECFEQGLTVYLDWPGTHGELPASASQVLGLKMCTVLYSEICFKYVII